MTDTDILDTTQTTVQIASSTRPALRGRRRRSMCPDKHAPMLPMLKTLAGAHSPSAQFHQFRAPSRQRSLPLLDDSAPRERITATELPKLRFDGPGSSIAAGSAPSARSAPSSRLEAISVDDFLRQTKDTRRTLTLQKQLEPLKNVEPRQGGLFHAWHGFGARMPLSRLFSLMKSAVI